MPARIAAWRVRHRPAPILVTGVPRSGTTWLARWLATSPGLALAGREPMNTRTPRQYALAGTIDGWARLTDPTEKQRRALRLTYRGLHPAVYSRYGFRQWAAPLPGTRLVMKDPFALLSIPAIVSVTGARPVLVYRHPGAVLASYRRMGWDPDLAEVQGIVEEARRSGGPDLPDLPPEGTVPPAEAMGHFWTALHELALADTAGRDDLLVVSHQELASSGPEGGRRLADRLDLAWTPAMEAELAKEGSATEGSSTTLHNFDRAPSLVAEAWRGKLTPEEIRSVEAVTEATRARLDAVRLDLRPAGS